MTNKENTARPALTGDETTARRFLTVDQVAAELNVSENQIRAMLHNGEIRGIQIGGRGIWRIGRADLEAFIDDAYTKTAVRIASGDLSEHNGKGEH